MFSRIGYTAQGFKVLMDRNSVRHPNIRHISYIKTNLKISFKVKKIYKVLLLHNEQKVIKELFYEISY